MDATRCIIVHLAATQSLQHTICDDSISLEYYGFVVGVIAFWAVATNLAVHEAETESRSIPQDAYLTSECRAPP